MPIKRAGLDSSGYVIGVAALRQKFLGLEGEIYFAPNAGNQGIMLTASWSRRSGSTPALAWASVAIARKNTVYGNWDAASV